MKVKVREEIPRECFDWTALLHVFQDLRQLLRQRPRREAAFDPTVQDERRELAFENRGGIQKAARRLDASSEHFIRVNEEEQVMRTRIGDGRDKRASVFAARAAR